MQKKRKGGGEIILFSICLSTHQESAAICPSLPPSLNLHLPPPPPSPYLPFISHVPHFIHPSFMCFTIAATIGSFGKPSITELHLICPHLTRTHTHTQNIPLYKGAIKTTSFPPVFCLKKLVISFNCASLCAEQYVFQCFLSDCLK